MRTHRIKLLDIVALTVDPPEDNLWRGQIGTVVEILADSSAYEVGFSDRNRRTYESLGLEPTQLMLLRFEPVFPFIIRFLSLMQHGIQSLSKYKCRCLCFIPLIPRFKQKREADASSYYPIKS